MLDNIVNSFERFHTYSSFSKQEIMEWTVAECQKEEDEKVEKLKSKATDGWSGDAMAVSVDDIDKVFG